MGSSFFEFNVATTGLFVAKKGFEVTANNIVNSATDGYSRQVVLAKASAPLRGTGGVGMVGTGSEVYGVAQMRDFYLDKKYWSQNPTYGEYEVKNTQLALMETVFNTLGSGNVSGVFDDYFKAISSLSVTSGDNVYRNGFVSNTETLITSITTIAGSLRKQQSDLNEDLYATVNQINTLGAQISALNKQIYGYEQTGNGKANELRDERAMLVDKLSKYANIEVKERDGSSGLEQDKQFIVFLNGQEFVNHVYNTEMQLVRREDKVNEHDVDGLYDIVWQNGKAFNTKGLSGDLKGILDVRDGNMGMDADGNTNYKGIPYYIDKLNTLVQTIAKAFNEGKHMDDTDIEGIIGHMNGYDANGKQGDVLFTYKDADGNEARGTLDYSQINVFNLCLNSDILGNPSFLAASDSPEDTDISNNKVILGFIELQHETGLFQEGKLHDYVAAVSNSLALDKKQADNFETFYGDVLMTVENQRLQVSGVSINEETVNIIRYNQLYQAASKLISVINGIYDTTINRMGV